MFSKVDFSRKLCNLFSILNLQSFHVFEWIMVFKVFWSPSYLLFSKSIQGFEVLWSSNCLWFSKILQIFKSFQVLKAFWFSKHLWYSSLKVSLIFKSFKKSYDLFCSWSPSKFSCLFRELVFWIPKIQKNFWTSLFIEFSVDIWL